jgi:hypothetical protein
MDNMKEETEREETNINETELEEEEEEEEEEEIEEEKEEEEETEEESSSSGVNNLRETCDGMSDQNKMLVRVGAGVVAGAVTLKLIQLGIKFVLGRLRRARKSRRQGGNGGAGAFVEMIALDPPPVPPPPAAPPVLHGLTFAFDDVYVRTLPFYRIYQAALATVVPCTVYCSVTNRISNRDANRNGKLLIRNLLYCTFDSHALICLTYFRSVICESSFAVEGQVTGFGNPDWATTHEVSDFTSPILIKCIKSGAKGVGKTIVGELAYE